MDTARDTAGAEEPLVLAGVGLAIGAAIGGTLPSTETENRAFGEASDQVKDNAAYFADEQYQKGKRVVAGAVGEAVQDAADRGWGAAHAAEPAASDQSRGVRGPDSKEHRSS